MIVIADTSPIQYLVLTRCIDVLPAIYGVVHAPGAVFDELNDPGAPPEVRAWMSNAPAWLVKTDPSSVLELHPKLGRGERAAISLAIEQQQQGVFVIIDDAKGRVLAEGRGIGCIGTIGVLQVAGNRGLLDFSEAIKRLRGTNMHLPARFQ